jgi:hypothetical protein
LLYRQQLDTLISGKGKTGAVKVEAVVTDDIKRMFVSRATKSTIGAQA